MELSQENNRLHKPDFDKDLGIVEKYGRLFERVMKSDILPTSEINWTIDNLDNNLNRTFNKYGNVALSANEGKIFMTLSGGLDSTLALAYLRKNFPKKEIITFTMGGSANHPDILHARLAAEKFRSTHYEFIPSPDEIAESLEEYNNEFPNVNIPEATKNGDTDVYLLYKYISNFRPKALLAFDGIDELVGGYWDHRKDTTQAEKECIYYKYWDELVSKHLVPLTRTSNNFGIKLLFPYLDEVIINSISDIPVSERCSINESKKPLREIGKKLGLPTWILTRPKRGQVGMLDIK